jgi:hypothetical protein
VWSCFLVGLLSRGGRLTCLPLRGRALGALCASLGLAVRFRLVVRRRLLRFRHALDAAQILVPAPFAELEQCVREHGADPRVNEIEKAVFELEADIRG